MTDTDWQDTWNLIGELWPKVVDDATTEQQLAFRRVLDPVTEHDARPILRAVAEKLTYNPRPAHIASAVRQWRDRKRDRGEATPDIEAMRADRERYHHEREAMLNQVRALSDEDRRGHAVRVIAANPTLKALAHRDARRMPLLAALVCRRIEAELGPGDPVGIVWSLAGHRMAGRRVTLTDEQIAEADRLVWAEDAAMEGAA